MIGSYLKLHTTNRRKLGFFCLAVVISFQLNFESHIVHTLYCSSLNSKCCSVTDWDIELVDLLDNEENIYSHCSFSIDCKLFINHLILHSNDQLNNTLPQKFIDSRAPPTPIYV